MELPNTIEGNATAAEYELLTDNVEHLEAVRLLEFGHYVQLKDVESLGLNVPANMTVLVDVYDGPDGQGFVTRVDATVDGVHYRRIANKGPEKYRASDGWILVEEA
jgi:hypothetical protein